MNNIHEFYFCRLKNSNGSTKSKSTTEHLRLFGLVIKFKQNRTKLMITFFKISDTFYSASNRSVLWLIRIKPKTSPGGKFGFV